MPFISPSVAHLGLRTISVKARPEDLVPLLDGVSPSPALSGIVFPYMRDSTTSVAALKAILRRIAARTTTSNLFLRVEGRNARALDAEEKEKVLKCHLVDSRLDVEVSLPLPTIHQRVIEPSSRPLPA